MNIPRTKNLFIGKVLSTARLPQIIFTRIICSKFLSDKTFIKIQYRIKTGRKLNLNNPQTFREKIQWLKLYDRNPIYTLFVDKVACKDYLKEKIGEKYME